MPVAFSQLGDHGRLGNSMFQMAATIGVALKHNDSYIFPRWQYWKDLNISGCYADNIIIKHRYEEPGFTYKPIPYRNNLDLFGYFQSEKYFKHCEEDISKLLAPKRSVQSLPKTASIHVRRGDYLEPHLAGCYVKLNMGYYERAMSMLNVKRFLVFSDDVEWCKSHFVGKKFDVIENNHPPHDLALMMACENNIIANSSFSWWAAWLNPNPDKKIIAPLKWFGPKLAPTHDTSDLVPDGWVRI